MAPMKAMKTMKAAMKAVVHLSQGLLSASMPSQGHDVSVDSICRLPTKCTTAHFKLGTSSLIMYQTLKNTVGA